MQVRVLLADDHAILRQGLIRILERYPDICVVAEASSGLEAIQKARELTPDVVIMDISMKGLNGIEATAQILRNCPNTSVLILSMHQDERYVVRALRAGAQGYLLKDAVEQELVDAIYRVREGDTFFSLAVAPAAAKALQATAADDRYELLTERERQIYLLLAEGKSNKEIALLFGLSLHTVETHRTRIMEKMNLHSAAELVLSAVRRGFVS